MLETRARPQSHRVKSSKARQVLLGLTALVFAGIAVASLVMPREMAEGLGYSLNSVDALSEFRAVYVGLWLATAVLMVVALRRVREAILGDLCAILVLGQTVGRVVSLLLDKMPSGRVWPIVRRDRQGQREVALMTLRRS